MKIVVSNNEIPQPLIVVEQLSANKKNSSVANNEPLNEQINMSRRNLKLPSRLQNAEIDNNRQDHISNCKEIVKKLVLIFIVLLLVFLVITFTMFIFMPCSNNVNRSFPSFKCDKCRDGPYVLRDGFCQLDQIQCRGHN